MTPRSHEIEARRAAVLRLALDGVPPREIAERLSLHRHIVASDIKQLRERGIDIPDFRTTNDVGKGCFRITIPRETMSRFAAPARRRKIPPKELARRILDVVGSLDLVDDVLDDLDPEADA